MFLPNTARFSSTIVLVYLTTMTHQQSKRSIAKVLITLLVIVALLHIAAMLLQHFAPHSWLGSNASMFDVDQEHNVPTVFNGLLWGAAAFMVLLLAVRPQKLVARARWAFISLLFFYFGFDEILVIHENLAKPVRHMLHIGDGNIFYHAWIIPALVVAAGIAVLYKLTASKPRPSAEQKTILKLLLILALGDVFLEAIGTQLYGNQLFYKLGPVLIEEMFEMSMISLMLYRLTTYVLEDKA